MDANKKSNLRPFASIRGSVYSGPALRVVSSFLRMVVRLQMAGACSGCPISALTVRLGIERLLKERVPEISAIETEGVADPEWE